MILARIACEYVTFNFCSLETYPEVSLEGLFEADTIFVKTYGKIHVRSNRCC